MKYAFAIASLMAALLLAIPAAHGADDSDHPLISRYPGSQMSRKDIKEFDEYVLITGLDADQKPTGESLEGELTRIHYYQPRDRSTLEIFTNYRDALADAGFEILFECANEECGPAYAASGWNQLNGITTKSGADCRYLAARLVSEDGEIDVAVMVGTHRHQIDIMEVKGMEKGLVRVDAAAMANSIERQGFVSLYGIYFDTDKAILKPDSEPTLVEIAKLMAEKPELKVYVVGHTDSDGTFSHNMNLAADRARAVVKALVDRHGIAPTRLDAHGVGPLVPRATNRTDSGKGKNRRVELVEQ